MNYLIVLGIVASVPAVMLKWIVLEWRIAERYYSRQIEKLTRWREWYEEDGNPIVIEGKRGSRERF
jgi:hypothetical protein